MEKSNCGYKTAIKQKTVRRVPSMSWRLFCALAIFVVVILLLVWVFQVVLLNVFYEASKIDEFYSVEKDVMSVIDDSERLNDIITVRSIDSDMCIRIFKVSNGKAEQIANSTPNTSCVIHNISNDGLLRLYDLAKEHGGQYIQRLSNTPGMFKASSTVYVSIRTNENGYKYVMMFDSELAPFNATVDTLERQFGWIMCLLIIGAVVLAGSLSRIICTPIVRMSRSARKLAKGDYDEIFEGGGYKEVTELADTLNFAASELKKNDNLQKELVANISHDLRTPLTMIKGYSEVMRDIPGENNPENVQVIIDETERLTELVNDVLDLSKIKSGTIKPEPEVFNLTETVRSVMMRYEKLTERDGYDISFESVVDVCVNADTTMVLQVIYNLINNALNYTGEDKRVRIVQTVDDETVRISVSDTGEGISEDQIPFIWDRYYKVDKVHKRARIGTGIGLSIVKGILEAHRASYGVESKLGEGSTFWFEMEISSFCADDND